MRLWDACRVLAHFELQAVSSAQMSDSGGPTLGTLPHRCYCFCHRSIVKLSVRLAPQSYICNWRKALSCMKGMGSCRHCAHNEEGSRSDCIVWQNSAPMRCFVVRKWQEAAVSSSLPVNSYLESAELPLPVGGDCGLDDAFHRLSHSSEAVSATDLGSSKP